MNYKKLAISQLWIYNTYPYNPRLPIINKYIFGIFNKFNIITSNIYINEFPKLYSLHFTIFIYQQQHYLILKKILNFLRPLITLRYNKNIIFNIKLTPSIYHDQQFLTQSFKYLLQQNPAKLRLIIKQIMDRKLIVKNKPFIKNQPILHNNYKPTLKQNLYKININAIKNYR